MACAIDETYDGFMRWICLALFACSACGITDFDIDQPIPAQTIQGSALPGPLAAIFPIPLSLDISQQIKSMDTGPISSVTLKSLDLTITSSGADWSFVTEIDVSVSSTKSGSSLPKVEIAHVTSPGKVTDLQFVVDPTVDLNPYINEGSEVDAQGSGSAPSTNVTYDGAGTFTVHPV
jgi:hypothetical protein